MSRVSPPPPVQLSTNPYKSTSPRLRLSVIAFVDVLGYVDLIREPRSPSENLELLARLHEALRRSRQWLDGPASDRSTREDDEEDLHALVAFTDNIVIGWPVDPWGLPEIELDPILDDAELSSVLPSWVLPDFNLRWRTPVSL